MISMEALPVRDPLSVAEAVMVCPPPFSTGGKVGPPPGCRNEAGDGELARPEGPPPGRPEDVFLEGRVGVGGEGVVVGRGWDLADELGDLAPSGWPA